jgi:multiple sugar transport system permease protein
MRKTGWIVLQWAILVGLLVLSFIPVFTGILMSLKSTLQIYTSFFSWPSPVQWGNYSKAALELVLPLGNTLWISAVSILGALAIAAIAAYAFARLYMAGKNVFFFIMLSLLMVPAVIMMVPDFVLAVELNLRDTHLGLILFYIAGAQPFAIFLMRSFFEAQPEELFESARLDGANEIQSLLRIALPLARPILITVGIMDLLGHYNDLIFPMLMLVTPSKQTLMIALQKYAPMQKMLARPDIAVQTAGYMLACVPLLLVFTFGMKYYIAGLTSGAVKG